MTPAPQWQPVPDFQARPAAPGAAKTGPARDLERTLGVNWLSKIGMVVLVLGVVFFLRYAFEQGWITIPMRIVLGVVGGLALGVTGDLLRWRDRERFGVYGQVLAGGGAAIVFFSLFAAYQFEEYRAATGMKLEIDAILLGLTAVGLGGYAVVRRAPVLAMEAVGLGTLASLFGDEFAAFSVVYTLLLTGAVVAAAAWRRWPWVLASGVGAAYFNLFILHALEVDPWHLLFGTIALLAIFTLATFTPERTSDPQGAVWYIVAGAAWLASWALVLLSLDRLPEPAADWQGPATAAFAVAALALALLARVPAQARWGWAIGFFVTSALWPPIQFDGFPVAVAWAGLTFAACAAIALRNHEAVRGYAGGIGAILVGRLATVETFDLLADELGPAEGAVPFFLGTVALMGGWFLTGLKGNREDPLARSLLGLGLVPPLLYAAGTLDGFAVPIAWTVEAVLVLVAGFGFAMRDLRMGALALFALVLGRIFFVDLLELDLAVRIITFLVVGGLLLLASFLYARRQRATKAAVAPDAPALK